MKLNAYFLVLTLALSSMGMGLGVQGQNAFKEYDDECDGNTGGLHPVLNQTLNATDFATSGNGCDGIDAVQDTESPADGVLWLSPPGGGVQVNLTDGAGYDAIRINGTPVPSSVFLNNTNGTGWQSVMDLVPDPTTRVDGSKMRINLSDDGSQYLDIDLLGEDSIDNDDEGNSNVTIAGLDILVPGKTTAGPRSVATPAIFPDMKADWTLDEIHIKLPASPDRYYQALAYSDLDDDGWTDFEELNCGGIQTNPLNPAAHCEDFDGDGDNNTFEDANGGDKFNPNTLVKRFFADLRVNVTGTPVGTYTFADGQSHVNGTHAKFDYRCGQQTFVGAPAFTGAYINFTSGGDMSSGFGALGQVPDDLTCDGTWQRGVNFLGDEWSADYHQVGNGDPLVVLAAKIESIGSGEKSASETKVRVRSHTLPQDGTHAIKFVGYNNGTADNWFATPKSPSSSGDFRNHNDPDLDNATTWLINVTFTHPGDTKTVDYPEIDHMWVDLGGVWTRSTMPGAGNHINTTLSVPAAAAFADGDGVPLQWYLVDEFGYNRSKFNGNSPLEFSVWTGPEREFNAAPTMYQMANKSMGGQSSLTPENKMDAEFAVNVTDRGSRGLYGPGMDSLGNSYGSSGGNDIDSVKVFYRENTSVAWRSVSLVAQTCAPGAATVRDSFVDGWQTNCNFPGQTHAGEAKLDSADATDGALYRASVTLETGRPYLYYFEAYDGDVRVNATDVGEGKSITKESPGVAVAAGGNLFTFEPGVEMLLPDPVKILTNPKCNFAEEAGAATFTEACATAYAVGVDLGQLDQSDNWDHDEDGKTNEGNGQIDIVENNLVAFDEGGAGTNNDDYDGAGVGTVIVVARSPGSEPDRRVDVKVGDSAATDDREALIVDAGSASACVIVNEGEIPQVVGGRQDFDPDDDAPCGEGTPSQEADPDAVDACATAGGEEGAEPAECEPSPESPEAACDPSQQVAICKTDKGLGILGWEIRLGFLNIRL